MNIISILALVYGLLTQLACKPTEEAPEQLNATPKLEQTEKIEIRNLEKKPKAGVNELRVAGLSLAAYSIGNNKAVLVSFDSNKGIAEYYQYEFCPQENPDTCTTAWYHDSDFIVPGLNPGLYKFTINSSLDKKNSQIMQRDIAELKLPNILLSRDNPLEIELSKIKSTGER
ncbi:MAG: hypothetical protein AB8G05_18995, partial [Oligoflexales bacterium]